MHSPAKRPHLQQENTSNPETDMDVQNSTENPQWEDKSNSHAPTAADDPRPLRKPFRKRLTVKPLPFFA